jgi:hypothetical protein
MSEDFDEAERVAAAIMKYWRMDNPDATEAERSNLFCLIANVLRAEVPALRAAAAAADPEASE